MGAAAVAAYKMKTKTAIIIGLAILLVGIFILLRSVSPLRQSASDPSLSACLMGQNGCPGGSQNNPSNDASAVLLGPEQLASMLKQKDFCLVNVHTPYEGEIQKTDGFIPYDKIEDNLGKLPKDKNAKIVLYCRSGRMSGLAAKTLAKLGYTNLFDLSGGMIAWEKSGYTIIKK